MWICGGLAPCGPSALLVTKKDSFGKEDNLAIPHILGPKIADFSKEYCFYPFIGQKVVFWVKKRCFGVFWTRCEIADLKQRQEITTMDDRNKIPVLTLPTYDPTDRLQCTYRPARFPSPADKSFSLGLTENTHEGSRLGY